MSKSELLVRSILGPIRSDIRPLVCDRNRLRPLFVQKVSWDDIRVTKDIYPSVAKAAEAHFQFHCQANRATGKPLLGGLVG